MIWWSSPVKSVNHITIPAIQGKIVTKILFLCVFCSPWQFVAIVVESYGGGSFIVIPVDRVSSSSIWEVIDQHRGLC